MLSQRKGHARSAGPRQQALSCEGPIEPETWARRGKSPSQPVSASKPRRMRLALRGPSPRGDVCSTPCAGPPHHVGKRRQGLEHCRGRCLRRDAEQPLILLALSYWATARPAGLGSQGSASPVSAKARVRVRQAEILVHAPTGAQGQHRPRCRRHTVEGAQAAEANADFASLKNGA